MWKKFLIRLAFTAVAEVIIFWAKKQGKAWALDLESFLAEIKQKI